MPAEFYLIGSVHQSNQKQFEEQVIAINTTAQRDAVKMFGELSHEKSRQLLGQCDVGLYPFPYTVLLDGAMSIKVFEYLGLGKPVIASNLTGTREVIKPEVNGLLVAPDDPESLAHAVQRLVEDPELLAAMTAHARSSVEPFGWNRIMERWSAAMRELAQRVNNAC